jgi:5'-3' exonuclease
MEFNLLIDGNYILSQQVFALVKSNMLFGKLSKSLEDCVKKLRRLHPFTKVYLVSDSRGSWRKGIYSEYKATRKKDSTIDWNFVFNTYDDFKKKCEELGIKVVEFPSVEGDDWIAKIIRKNNGLGISNLIVSSDRDLLQLVKCTTQSPSFINMMMTNDMFNSKLYMPKGYELLVEEHATPSNSLFGVEEEDIEQFVINLQTNRKMEIVCNEEKLFCKLIGGDKKSDNIPSVFEKNGRGIGDSGALTLYNAYKKNYPDPISFCTKEFVQKAALTVAECKKETSSETIQIVEKNLARNLKLIALEERFLPKDLSETMERMI